MLFRKTGHRVTQEDHPEIYILHQALSSFTIPRKLESSMSILTLIQLKLRNLSMNQKKSCKSFILYVYSNILNKDGETFSTDIFPSLEINGEKLTTIWDHF